MADAIPALLEEWRPVVGYEGFYEVSNLGRVRSISRIVVRKNGQLHPMRGRIKKPSLSQGYPLVNLSVGGESRTHLVHRLVAIAFIGEGEEGREVCHIDGDRANPRVDNLYWGTRAENLADSLRHGTWNNQNVGKTHCDHGHEFTPENTQVSYRHRAGRDDMRPERRCRTCNRERALARYYAKRGRSVPA